MQHNQRFLDLVKEAKKNIKETNVVEVSRWLEQGKEFVLIDNREESEWAKGHLPKAEYSGRGILERDIEAKHPDLNTEIVIYCGGGFRSALSVESVQKMGYTNVISMDGGFRGWKEAGYEIVK